METINYVVMLEKGALTLLLHTDAQFEHVKGDIPISEGQTTEEAGHGWLEGMVYIV